MLETNTYQITEQGLYYLPVSETIPCELLTVHFAERLAVPRRLWQPAIITNFLEYIRKQNVLVARRTNVIIEAVFVIFTCIYFIHLPASDIQLVYESFVIWAIIFERPAN